MIARISTTLPAPAEYVWSLLRKRDTFLYITRGALGFDNSEDWPEEFREGEEIETRLALFHLIPAWKHRLRLASVDAERFEALSRESGGPVRVWNHRIHLEPADARCRYTDEIEIKAGLLTPAVWTFAHLFYRYRQTRWRRLLVG